MPRTNKTPSRANGGGLPAGGQDPFQHAPMLTFQWGRFLAFLAILTALAFIAIALKPEAGVHFVAIYAVAVGALLVAAYMKLLD